MGEGTHLNIGLFDGVQGYKKIFSNMLIEIYGTGESPAPNRNYGWIYVEISARCLFIGIGGARSLYLSG